MNVASLELCKELFGLSGWEDTYFVYQSSVVANIFPREQANNMGFGYPNLPAYGLGYLLRKLPKNISDIDFVYWHTLNRTRDGWETAYEAVDLDKYSCEADTPEDAVCKLAIELFKKGLIK